MALRILNYYPTTLHLDGENVEFRIKRLTIDEKSEFMLRFNATSRENNAEDLAQRPQTDEEREMKPADLEARRWQALTPEARAERLAQEKAQTEKDNAFAKEAITAYVSLSPDQVFDEAAGRYITSGEDILRVFGARVDLITTLMSEIYLQNTLSADQKKKLKLLLDSRRGSNEVETGTGERPALIAGNAESEASAPPAAAMASPEESPSGATVLSS